MTQYAAPWRPNTARIDGATRYVTTGRPGWTSPAAPQHRSQISTPVDSMRSDSPFWSFTVAAIRAPNPENWKPFWRRFRTPSFRSTAMQATARMQSHLARPRRAPWSNSSRPSPRVVGQDTPTSDLTPSGRPSCGRSEDRRGSWPSWPRWPPATTSCCRVPGHRSGAEGLARSVRSRLRARRGWRRSRPGWAPFVPCDKYGVDPSGGVVVTVRSRRQGANRYGWGPYGI
jgi:hypothetical protein